MNNKVAKKPSARKTSVSRPPMGKNINKVLVGIVVVLSMVLIVLVALQFLFMKDGYYAVYLRTGDIYFGKIVKFPYFGLKNVYTIQMTQDPSNPLRIQKFTDVFWGPEDYLKLNRDEVVWYTQLKSDGQLYQLLKTNPNLVPSQQQLQAQQQLQNPVNPAPTSGEETIEETTLE